MGCHMVPLKVKMGSSGHLGLMPRDLMRSASDSLLKWQYRTGGTVGEEACILLEDVDPAQILVEQCSNLDKEGTL